MMLEILHAVLFFLGACSVMFVLLVLAVWLGSLLRWK